MLLTGNEKPPHKTDYLPLRAYQYSFTLLSGSQPFWSTLRPNHSWSTLRYWLRSSKTFVKEFMKCLWLPTHLCHLGKLNRPISP